MDRFSEREIKASHVPQRERNFSGDFAVIRLGLFLEKRANRVVIMKETKKPLKLGPTLQNQMREQGLTIKELSFQSGVPLSTLAHFKNNRPPKDVAAVQRVAECLNCSLHFLLFGEPENKKVSTDIAAELFTGVFEVTVKRIKKRGES